MDESLCILCTYKTVPCAFISDTLVSFLSHVNLYPPYSTRIVLIATHIHIQRISILLLQVYYRFIISPPLCLYNRYNKGKTYNFCGYFGKYEVFVKLKKDQHHPWNIPKYDTKYQSDSLRGSK